MLQHKHKDNPLHNDDDELTFICFVTSSLHTEHPERLVVINGLLSSFNTCYVIAQTDTPSYQLGKLLYYNRK